MNEVVFLVEEAPEGGYTARALGDRLGDPHNPAWGFVREVLQGPKRWVAGDDSVIAPLAAAAGVPLGGAEPGEE